MYPDQAIYPGILVQRENVIELGWVERDKRGTHTEWEQVAKGLKVASGRNMSDREGQRGKPSSYSVHLQLERQNRRTEGPEEEKGQKVEANEAH